MRYFFSLVILAFAPLCLAGQTFNGSGGPIPDDGNTYEFSVNVSGLNPASITSTHGLFSVCFNITHPYFEDLVINLRSPQGMEQTLVSRVGGSGDNFNNTCLTAVATQSIYQGSAPFNGSYKPFEWLGNFNNGQNGNGTWKLVIRDAYAFADAGTLNSWSITFASGVTGPFPFLSSNLPIVILNTNGQEIVDEPKVEANMKIIDNGPGMINHINDINYTFNGKIGIEIRGHFSSGFPQKPYGFETWDALNNDTSVSLMGMPAESDWILQCTHTDKSFLRNVLAFEISRTLGHYAPRNRYCEVVLNGVYKGVYIFCEKIKRDANRVDIADLDSVDISWPGIGGGYIFKNDYWEWSNSWQSSFSPINHPGFDVHFVYDYPESDEILTVQKNYIQAYVDSFETALYSPGFADPVNGYRKYCDVSSFVDYLIVNELARNNDGFKKSVYYYKDKGGKLSMGPVWDFDWAWKNINECSIFSASDGSGWAYNVNDCNPDVNGTGWWVRMMQDTAMANLVTCRWLSLRNNLLDTNTLFSYIDSVALALDSAQNRHYLAWPIHGIWWGVPEVDPPTASYQEEVDRLKNWIGLRISWLDANMPGNCFTVDNPEEVSSRLSLTFMPNPVREMLFLFSNESAITRVEVYDIQGKLSGDFSFTPGNEVSIDMKNFPTGLYALRVTCKNVSETIKVIKK